MIPDDVQTIDSALQHYLHDFSDVFVKAYHVRETVQVVTNTRRYQIEVVEKIDFTGEPFDAVISVQSGNHWEALADFPSCARSDVTSVLMEVMFLIYQQENQT